jgi:hypothetical protein
VSPILVRPVREQLEHDRIIRLLQVRLKRRHDIAANVGDEQTAGVRVGAGQMFPDLVLTSQDRARRVETIVEVETGESVNHLEAMAQWAQFGRFRAAFHLYVPANMVDVARRLCADNKVSVAELWSYHTIGDQTRFTLVQRSAPAAERQPRPRAAAPASPSVPSKPSRTTRKSAAPARKIASASRKAPARKAAARKTVVRKSSGAQKRK